VRSTGLGLQGVALIGVGIAQSWGFWLPAMIALGLGTALVYPTFLSAVSDHSQPSWRAIAIGAYRWWRDLGYVVGAILAGVLADRFGIPASVQLVGGVTIISGFIVAMTYRERVGAQSDASAVLRPAPRVVGQL
jgi:MFS family permease